MESGRGVLPRFGLDGSAGPSAAQEPVALREGRSAVAVSGLGTPRTAPTGLPKGAAPIPIALGERPRPRLLVEVELRNSSGCSSETISPAASPSCTSANE